MSRWRTLPAAEAAGSALSASQSDFFDLITIRHVFQSHCPIGIPKIFFQLFESLALRHDLRAFQKLPEQEVLSLPVHHGQSRLHPVLVSGDYAGGLDTARRSRSAMG